MYNWNSCFVCVLLGSSSLESLSNLMKSPDIEETLTVSENFGVWIFKIDCPFTYVFSPFVNVLEIQLSGR